MGRRGWLSAVAAVALIGGLVSAGPAAASDGGDPGVVSEQEDSSRDDASTSGGADGADGDPLPDNGQPDGPVEPLVEEPLVEEPLVEEEPPIEEPLEVEGSSFGGSERGGSGSIEDLAAIGADESPGSFGGVEESTFDTMWESGSVVPSRVSAVLEDDSVELRTWRADDGSVFLAWLVIDSAEAATEYRFERAVPEGYSASVQPDGSVLFVDAQGDEAGGIAVPWAFDVDGAEVPTGFRLDGDALIQTVDHSGANYPVTADPAWFLPLVAVAIRVAVIYGPRVAAAVQGCQRVQCGPAIGKAIGSAKPGNRNPPGRRPSKDCRSPNRSGC